MENTPEENTDLDYYICDYYQITMDTLDAIPIFDVKIAREYIKTKIKD